MSRFVSGGTDEQPTARDDAWLKAQQELDAKHLARVDAAKQDGGGRSLYETLQANKAAKQEAFDAKAKLSNQFQNLNEDEVAFLDDVLHSERAREQSVRRETSEQLLAFKRQQEEAESLARQSEVPLGSASGELAVPSAEAWAVGPRKRKKEREREGIGGLVKVRRTSARTEGESVSSSEHGVGGAVAEKGVCSPPEDGIATRNLVVASPEAERAARKTDVPSKAALKVTPKLGVVAYSSDEDD